MTRARTTFWHGLGYGVVAALTTWVTLFSWSGFVQSPGRFLGPLFVMGFLVALVGAAGRWAGLYAVVVWVCQLLAAGVYFNMLYGGPEAWGPFPTAASLTEIGRKLGGSFESANQYAAPIPGSAASAAPLLVLGGVLFMLLVDLLAATLGRVALAGLPLLTVYSLPGSLLDASVSWWVFALSAAGFLSMLYLTEDDRFAQWGRSVDSRRDGELAGSAPAGVRTGSARDTAVAIGAGVTAMALFVPVLVPTLELELFAGAGRGTGSGGDQITIENAMTDLRRDLRRGEDIPLLRLTTENPSPRLLRFAVLTVFGQNAWSSGDREVPPEQVADGSPLPAPVGISGLTPREEYATEVRVGDELASRWLPTSPLVSAVTAPGDWRYDLSTMDFLSADDDDTRGLEYSFTEVELDLSTSSLASADLAPGSLRSTYTALPANTPGVVGELAAQVTAGARTDFERARMLQEWFQDPDEFEYSLQNSEPGNGTDTLEYFLGPDGRVGYCEQFASAMAAMARALGIPARVVVGFLAPDRIGDGEWEYSAWDFHAWPELYFEGAGWVYFEPTPTDRTGTLPDYTTQPITGADPTSTVSANPTDDLPTRAGGETANPSPDPGADAGTGANRGLFWWPVLTGLVLLVAAAVAATVPRTLRRLRRERRWLGATAEDAWAELRDSVLDLRLSWPAGRSPREAGKAVGQLFGAVDGDPSMVRPRRGRGIDPEAGEALDRLVLAVERERYSPRPVPADPAVLRRDVERCVAALEAGVTPRQRRLAEWLPRSLRRRTPHRPAPALGLTEERAREDLVDHMS